MSFIIKNVAESAEAKGKDINSSGSATTGYLNSRIVAKFPESTRCWPHPGITTELRSRKDYEQLEILGNVVMQSYLAKGKSVAAAGQLAHKEVMGNAFSFTEEDISETPYITDRVCYEEACDYVEQNWLHAPLSTLTTESFMDMLKRVHTYILDENHFGLKGMPTGQFREAKGFEMVVFKNPEDSQYTFHESIENRKKASKHLPNHRKICEQLDKAERELGSVSSFSFYETIHQKLASPSTLDFLNSFVVTFPPNKQVVPLLKEMISQIQKKLNALEENKINKMCVSTALSIEEMIITGRFSLRSLAEMAGAVKEDAIGIAAFAHLEFVRIHPFPEGNGRMARKLMNIINMQDGVQPVGFPYCKPYIAAIRADEAGCKGAFETFLRKTIEDATPVPLYKQKRPLSFV